MISETNFSRSYSSFWIEHFPWLNSFCQSMNKTMIQRVHPPIGINEDPKFRSINNIIAFIHYCNKINFSTIKIEKSVKEALIYAKRFPRNHVADYTFNKFNKIIVKKQVENLQKQYKEPDILSPFFPGCGIIDSCYGDIIYNGTLVEVKAGERNFQPSDLKQIITYLALNWIMDNPYIIKNICLYNPRMGYLWIYDIITFMQSITSIVKEDAFDQLTKYLLEESQDVFL